MLKADEVHFPECKTVKLNKWADTLAKSKLSPERRARLLADVERELLDMQEKRQRVDGASEVNLAAKTGRRGGEN
jgi:hypothetical protein